MDRHQAASARQRILDATEQLIIGEGYAAVTVRRVAREAHVAPTLVQYYFPTLDDLFLAVLRRSSDLEMQRQYAVLDGTHPLRALWEFGRDPGTALITEFMALANHRKTIRAEISKIAEQYRKAQLEFLAANATGEDIALPGVSPVALLVLMTMIARGFMMENSLGVTVGHAEALAAVEDILAAVENRSDPAGTRRDDEARTAGP
ncbi:TetR/AcrR family transcriptional regulator [Frankia sp. CcI49]|uniref:TetR/AcrR family transcriptional regulator n=1 Tax=Frankia sp. CcI49 TaxID=1745382 RepID=UPI001F516DDF|nr:TetR/AcrR family transcriptional regulator [Frankia sp. CcI49]